MSDIDKLFRDIEADLSGEFGKQEAATLWGEVIDSTTADMTIKGGGPNATIAETDRDAAGPEAEGASIMLTVHSDGSASMTMPGASVGLSPRRASFAAGAEYEIGETIGMGGMGVIQLARQASLDRRIVVKSIRPEMAHEAEVREKFITEALATGFLDHPNVVPVHDMGIDGDGRLFYAMKEVRGENWRRLMPELGEAENIEILQRVSDAVACAHDKGIIHRDLKPENVMIGDYGEVLVMDWGLAAAIAPEAKAAPLTDANSCAGTPGYMAPEMARGLARDLGPWSDQYLLGAILFHIIARRPPHPGRQAKEGLLNAANNVIAATERADEWMDVAMRAMATMPGDRFPSVKEFQKALRNCQVHGESILLAGRAAETLDEAGGEKGYEKYDRAVHGFEQALGMWEGNAKAANGLGRARLAYAGRAFGNGDFDLALSLTSGSDGEAEKELAGKAERGRAVRESRRRRVRRLTALAAAALFLAAVIAGAASFVISRQADAERQAREEAERQRSTAESALAAAETARRAEAEAKDSELRGQRARIAAEETARREAENARRRAEEALAARGEIQRLGYLEDNSRWRFDSGEAARRQREEAERLGLETVRRIDLPGGVTLRLIFVPSGSFVMGSPPRDPSRNNDEYLHDVVLDKPFHMGETEVTRGQWQAAVGVESMEGAGARTGDDGLANIAWRFRRVEAEAADLPATGVSFLDITTLFLPRLAETLPEGETVRLPTEAEWEWAARAGTTGHYYTGDAEEDLDRSGWYEHNAGARAHRAGGKEANPWGIHDMIGNVAELTLDAYDPLYYLRSPLTNPVNLDPGTPFRICRGGSFVNSPRLCRMSNRTYMHSENRYPHAGFRIVVEGPVISTSSRNCKPCSGSEAAEKIVGGYRLDRRGGETVDIASYNEIRRPALRRFREKRILEVGHR